MKSLINILIILALIALIFAAIAIFGKVWVMGVGFRGYTIISIVLLLFGIALSVKK